MCKGLPDKAICSICKEEKPTDNFYQYKTERLGLTTFRSQCKKCCSEKFKQKYESKDAITKKNGALKNAFGITLVEYDRMYQIQSGRCRICNRHSTETKKWLSVDHCHTTGRVRGLLCAQCNSGIGFLQDNPELLRKAASYLTEGVH